MLIDLKEMLENGFRAGNAHITTPKSISTAATVTTQIIAQVASHIYGGNTINRIDEVLAPYVAISYEKHLAIAEKYNIQDPTTYAWERTEKETYDACQTMAYQISSLQTSNGQTPFTTFGFGLGTSKESRLIQKSILEVSIKGIGEEGDTAIFPKLVFVIKDGLNLKPQDPNYDIKLLALECTSKRMYPDIINYEKIVEITGSFKFPMGCRSFLNQWENEAGEEIHEGRNNLGVVSLNLPRIALQSKNLKEFYKKLDKKLALCKKALYTRIERFKFVKAKVAPILYVEGACGVRLDPEDFVIDIFKNGRASISLGYIGLNETVNALFPDDDLDVYDSAQKRDETHCILAHMNAVVQEWKKESGWGFSLYSTPSENLCDRFCRIDTKEFGIVKGVTDKGYYTNSFHLSVEKCVTPFQKMDFEKDYPIAASGGFISYAEYPDMKHNLKALEMCWDYSYDKLPYLGTNLPVDSCHNCNYDGEFTATAKGFSCPQCGNNDPTKMNVIRRICGYLGQPQNRPLVEGKQNEVILRFKHFGSNEIEGDA